MKKILYIIILLFSCDDLGVQEFEESFSYYDHLSYGWAKVFENDIDYATFYFDGALDTDITYYNNAMVGMGWSMTYMANNCLNPDYVNYTADCIDNSISELRNNAKCFFVRAVSEDQEELKSKKFDAILEWCESTSVNINSDFTSIDFMNIELSEIVSFYETECEADQSGNIEHTNCFEDFLLDLQVGYLYLEYLSYQHDIINNDQTCSDYINLDGDAIPNNTCDELDVILKLFIDFYNQNSLYNITDDKGVYNDNYDINYKKILARITQLYLDSNIEDKVMQSCEYAKKICTSLDCEGDDNQINNMQDILECIDSEL